MLTSVVRMRSPSLFPKRCPENALGKGAGMASMNKALRGRGLIPTMAAAWRALRGRRTRRVRTPEAAALSRISAAITATLDLHEVLRRIITESVQLLGAQSASVILHDAATQEAQLTTTYGQALSAQTLRYPLAGSLTGWVA